MNLTIKRVSFLLNGPVLQSPTKGLVLISLARVHICVCEREREREREKVYAVCWTMELFSKKESLACHITSPFNNKPGCFTTLN